MDKPTMTCIIDGKGYICHTVCVEYLDGGSAEYKAENMNYLCLNSSTTRAISIIVS